MKKLQKASEAEEQQFRQRLSLCFGVRVAASSASAGTTRRSVEP